MKAEAISKTEINRIMKKITKPFIWVSIREPENDDDYCWVSEYELCKDTLILNFGDMCCDDWSEEGIMKIQREVPSFVPFNLLMKRELDNFISKNNDVELCIINCHAGVSRSPALGAYIERETGETDWFTKFYESPIRLPCYYICRILNLPIKETKVTQKMRERGNYYAKDL